MEKLKLEQDIKIITDWEDYPIRKFSMVNLYPIVTCSMIAGPAHYIFGSNISDLHDFQEGYFCKDGLNLHLLECDNNLGNHNLYESLMGFYFQTSRFNNCDYYSISYGNKSLILSEKDAKLPLLDVHHKAYIVNRKAWEYEDDNLMTLCRACHEKEHLEHEVFLYDENNQPLHKLRTCDKCNGTGYLPKYHYYEFGVCFKCDGRGVL
ncbi:HNH endonuclease [Parabacteroides sp. ZJ-118]|uniref:HNH endonuclease n=1 Tax=Parabacteroides sp. ZJ-118 TaxID=2709398 RepID=UPI0013ED7327|nr:HNH endonuclease [Parabacteroides sp. ZJ-118]